MITNRFDTITDQKTKLYDTFINLRYLTVTVKTILPIFPRYSNDKDHQQIVE